jgi:hypothetical protein
MAEPLYVPSQNPIAETTRLLTRPFLLLFQRMCRLLSNAATLEDLPDIGGLVIGPASSKNDGLVLFDGTSGVRIKGTSESGRLLLTDGVVSTAPINLASSDVTGELQTANMDQTFVFNAQYYTMQAFSTATTPADSTTYYFGAFPLARMTTAALYNLPVIKAGFVVGVAVTVVNNSGTAGTGETSSIYIRRNNTTDQLISSALTTNTTSATVTNFPFLFPVAAGDRLQVKWVTPAWATNPGDVAMSVVIGMV